MALSRRLLEDGSSLRLTENIDVRVLEDSVAEYVSVAANHTGRLIRQERLNRRRQQMGAYSTEPQARRKIMTAQTREEMLKERYPEFWAANEAFSTALAKLVILRAIYPDQGLMSEQASLLEDLHDKVYMALVNEFQSIVDRKVASLNG